RHKQPPWTNKKTGQADCALSRFRDLPPRGMGDETEGASRINVSEEFQHAPGPAACKGAGPRGQPSCSTAPYHNRDQFTDRAPTPPDEPPENRSRRAARPRAQGRWRAPRRCATDVSAGPAINGCTSAATRLISTTVNDSVTSAESALAPASP